MGSKMEVEFRDRTGKFEQTVEFSAKKKLPPRYTLNGVTYRVHYDTKTGEFCYQQSNM